MARKCILILGGARSGKSRFAQELARSISDRVLMAATAEPLDEEMRRRIEEHRKNRPRTWQTLEAPINVGRSMAERVIDKDGPEVVILDCITLLVSNLLTRENADLEQIDYLRSEQRVAAEMDELIKCINKANASFVIVSNEVGLGLVPGSPVERLYRDLLGKANKLLAHHADEVYFMVAGVPLKIKVKDKA